VLSLLADPCVRLLDLLEPACRLGRAAVVIGMVELDEAVVSGAKLGVGGACGEA